MNSNKNKYNALLLSADHKLAETLRLVARLDGSTLGAVANSADALSCLQSQPPDLVLLDLKTTENECLELLRQLKHHPLPVFSIGLGVAGESSAPLRAFDLGLNEFYQLPIDNSLLMFGALRAAHIPAELHVFQTGRHGFGKKGGGADHFMDRLEEWMKVNSWLAR